ncbi:MAG: ADYC domain-containing protein, partial [Kofleriaceae bacterium]
SDVGMYGVSYQSSSGWQPLCGVDSAGVKILAVAVLGTWNYGENVVGGGAYTTSSTLQTFACRAKSIAKCVEMGYKPWAGRSTQLAACVRMLRGDYCGKGKPYTTDGTLVNLYDNVGIQADTAAWVKEAEWSVNGAVCVNTNGQPRFLISATKAPECLKGSAPTIPVTSTCGNTFGASTLIINELQTDTNTWQ